MAEAIEKPTTTNNMYCIKCRSHTDNVDEREEQITSKGKPRSVMKATCAVCSKKKNRFTKLIKNEADTAQAVVEQREAKISKKEQQLIDRLLEKFIKSQSIKSDENKS